ncbi:hypothetical protein [Candidatus Rickettsia kedanie]|uniref:Integrase DNA-binding domain-containing protein n=1 Tax=Candidatus Rickettsia kedanie TaxID=3115352 RepID=A0ABP9TUI4_9RICK
MKGFLIPDRDIKITKKGRWFRYYYVNNIDNIVNHDNRCYEIFDLKSAIIKFLKINTRKEFTASQIAVWIAEKYSQEAIRKVQTSNDKLLMSVNKMSDKKEIAILLYKKAIKTLLRTTIPKKPNIKIIKNGSRTRYCYINNINPILIHPNLLKPSKIIRSKALLLQKLLNCC